ncbi:hypothetical protein EOD39_3918 [Acipenser ruthenus]|uniref:Globin domain-containing protein n=1 Tax=Acipenser ruthenus TaxID=7906 RepID=A0A444UKI9_ACIRT|nr:hypothetical protein EOD39_3918 [Acipenser ruthenus]
MGCALCGPGVNHGARTAPEANESGVESGSGRGTGTGAWLKSEPLPLSEAQKGLIRESWKILHEDIARVGIIMFIRLFETHPECKDVFFIFRDIDDLQELKMSKELQAHGLRVMSFIEKSVARLSQEDKLEQIAFELGRSHCRYSAPPKYYEPLFLLRLVLVVMVTQTSQGARCDPKWREAINEITKVITDIPKTVDTGVCAQCESYQERPVGVFLENLLNFLQLLLWSEMCGT